MKFNLSKFKSLVRTFAPLVLANVKGGDKIAPHVDRIIEGIEAAEAVAHASSADKKAAVLALVTKGAEEAKAAGAHVDPVEVATIASHGIDTVIAVVNAAHQLPTAPHSTGD